MKHFLLATGLLLSASLLSAQDFGLYWKYKDYDGVCLTMGRAAFDIGSLFLKKDEGRAFVHRMKKLRIMVFDGYSPITERDINRFNRKAHRRHLEDVVMVREGKTHVRVLTKERRNALRKAVVLVHSPEETVFVSLKGKFRFDDLQQLLKKHGGKHFKREDGKVLPSIKSVPVTRI